MAYSAYAIKLCSRFLTATNEVCVEFFLAFRVSHSLSYRNPWLSTRCSGKLSARGKL